MQSDQEILRLQDLLPASWRMATKITAKSDCEEVITSTPLLPWANTTRITINQKLWMQLSIANRDLLLLREVSWRQQAKWFKPGTYQAIAALSTIGGIVELVQGDTVGIAIGIMLTTIAVEQVRRKSKGTQLQIEADHEALRVAQRRGYNEVAAAKSLLEAIQAVAKLERRSSMEFTELLRCQNLRAIAGLSSVNVPASQD
jgi:Protein of unknown function (DUF3318)